MGFYSSDAILGQTGTPATNTPVTVCVLTTSTPITLYTDQTGGTTTSNPINTDSYGNLSFYAPIGLYTLQFTVGGVNTSKNVEVPAYPGDFCNPPSASQS